jgi:hypothetical protein
MHVIVYYSLYGEGGRMSGLGGGGDFAETVGLAAFMKWRIS